MLVLSAKNYGSSGFRGSVSNALIDKMGSFQNDEIYGVQGRSRKSSASDVNCSFLFYNHFNANNFGVKIGI
jgi:hypothetical protein